MLDNTTNKLKRMLIHSSASSKSSTSARDGVDDTVIVKPAIRNPYWYLDQSIYDLKCKFQYIQYKEDLRLRDATMNQHSSKYTLGVSVSVANSKRNRYCDIMPYERNRIKLDVQDNTNDYINASYIKLKTPSNNAIKKYYIATQGPTANTVSQFWQMVYSKCVLGPDVVIVMVTPLVENQREKCYPYWLNVSSPKDALIFPRKDRVGDQISYFKQPLKLEYISEKIIYSSSSSGNSDKKNEKNHTYTTLKLTNMETGEYKNIHHLYFDKWADMTSPSSVTHVIDLIEHCDKLNSTYKNPIISHCSAGVGRTGTFVALDYIYSTVKFAKLNKGLEDSKKDGEENTLDEDLIQQVVLKLRSQRMKMVQTFDQYAFLYRAVKSLVSE